MEELLPELMDVELLLGKEKLPELLLQLANVNSLTLTIKTRESGTTSFVLSNDGEATLNYNITVTGNFGSALPKSGKNRILIA